MTDFMGYFPEVFGSGTSLSRGHTDFLDRLNESFAARSLLLTKDLAEYDGDPADPGAPELVKNAALGTWFREETAGKWWRKAESAWELPGGNPFDQSLNTTDNVKFNGVQVTDLLTDGGSAALQLGSGWGGPIGNTGEVWTNASVFRFGTGARVYLQNTISGVSIPLKIGTLNTYDAGMNDQDLNVDRNVNCATGGFFAGNGRYSFGRYSFQTNISALWGWSAGGFGSRRVQMALTSGYHGNRFGVLPLVYALGSDYGFTAAATDPEFFVASSTNPASSIEYGLFRYKTATSAFEMITSSGALALLPASKYVRVGLAASAPADAILENGEAVFWLDETGGNLMVKTKDSGGTVKSGTVAALA